MIEKEFKEQNKILEKWMIKNYGRRCPDYEKDCIVCKKWKLFDKLVL
mgnify:CR=1 FL=1